MEFMFVSCIKLEKRYSLLIAPRKSHAFISSVVIHSYICDDLFAKSVSIAL